MVLPIQRERRGLWHDAAARATACYRVGCDSQTRMLMNCPRGIVPPELCADWRARASLSCCTSCTASRSAASALETASVAAVPRAWSTVRATADRLRGATGLLMRALPSYHQQSEQAVKKIRLKFSNHLITLGLLHQRANSSSARRAIGSLHLPGALIHTVTKQT